MRRRQLVFLTRTGCGLCAEALPRLQRTARWFRCDVVVTDIAGDADLEAKYHLQIPVILNRHGDVVAEGVISRRDMLVAVMRSYL